MKHVSEILEDLRNLEVGVRCRKCGAVPAVVGNQYTVRCAACGNYITLSRNYLAWLKMQEHKNRYGKEYRKIKCALCEDRGYIITEEQADDTLAVFAYRCMCQTGQNRSDLAAWPVIPFAKAQAWAGRNER